VRHVQTKIPLSMNRSTHIKKTASSPQPSPPEEEREKPRAQGSWPQCRSARTWGLPMNRWRKRTPLPNPLPSEGRGKDLRLSGWFRGTMRELVRGNSSRPSPEGRGRSRAVARGSLALWFQDGLANCALKSGGFFVFWFDWVLPGFTQVLLRCHIRAAGARVSSGSSKGAGSFGRKGVISGMVARR
jgi:hypothetical protein